MAFTNIVFQQLLQVMGITGMIGIPQMIISQPRKALSSNGSSQICQLFCQQEEQAWFFHFELRKLSNWEELIL